MKGNVLSYYDHCISIDMCKGGLSAMINDYGIGGKTKGNFNLPGRETSREQEH